MRRSSKRYAYGELPLTAIETQTVELIVAGHSVGDIAKIRGVTVSTVKGTLANAMIKTGAQTRAQMAAKFVMETQR
jgi:DNA-binding CsgD family transcriptional regulator